MAAEEKKEAFLERWSRLKKEEKRELPAKDEAPALPPVEKLTPESDFTGFMHPKVEHALRRVALKKLFSDPHFNIPDPFEPYSRNFNEDPLPPELLATLKQAEQLVFGDKPKEKEQTAEKEQLAAEPEKPQTDEPGRQDA